MRKPHHPVAVATILKSILARRQPEATGQLAAATRAIEAAMPKPMHGRVRAEGTSGNALLLKVDNSALLQELRLFHENALVRALTTVPGLETVRTIRYRIGALPDGS